MGSSQICEVINIADITMCTSGNCPMREECYRVRAKPEKHQSWSNFEYTCNENSGFEDFIHYIKKSDVTLKNEI